MIFRSAYEVLECRVKTRGRENAIGVLRLGSERYDDFHFLTWAEVFKRVTQYGVFLQSLELQRGDRIALYGKNSMEWLCLDWAAQSVGLVTVPLYAQSHLDEVRYILAESQARIVFADALSESLPSQQILFSDLDFRASRIQSDCSPDPLRPDEVSSIIYTSGTIGKPKGAMHTARNFFEAIEVAQKVIRLGPRDRLFSYLPLSHVAERVLVDMGCLYAGAEVCICERVDKAIAFLPKARPTIFFAVPRVWETLQARIEKELRSNALVEDRLAKVPFFLRKWILGRFIKRQIGLDRTRFVVSGAAKLSSDVATKFLDWGIRIHEAYGLTETLCVSTINPPGRAVIGSVGRVYPSVDAKIEADGEVCVRANFHFKGYYKHPELDAEVIDSDGWFHTGDLGSFDEAGNLHITDRKKNIFKASNGKYVAPIAIENLLRQHPAVSEVVVIGENRPHCIAVACLEVDVDEGSVLKHLEFVNSKLASHEQIRSIGVCRRAWSPSSGEMTPSLKVKRKAVMEIYDQQIKELYETPSRVRFF